MLFRLELDPGIKRLRPINQLAKQYEPTQHNESESNKETDNCDGFDDDNYTFTSNDPANLAIVERALLEFEKLSGLGCNIDKTAVM
jgi:hypothetical protein